MNFYMFLLSIMMGNHFFNEVLDEICFTHKVRYILDGMV